MLAIDASVLLKLFVAGAERHASQAAAVVDAVAGGSIRLVAPAFLELEVINVLARKRGLTAPQLRVVLDSLDDLHISYLPVDRERLLHWTDLGLSAYDATYVAVARIAGVRLLTDDDGIAKVAGDIAMPLGTWAA